MNDILNFDIWLLIAELNPQTFVAIRSINREVYYYTRDNIEKYKKKFSTDAVLDQRFFTLKYEKLPLLL